MIRCEYVLIQNVLGIFGFCGLIVIGEAVKEGGNAETFLLQLLSVAVDVPKEVRGCLNEGLPLHYRAHVPSGNPVSFELGLGRRSHERVRAASFFCSLGVWGKQPLPGGSEIIEWCTRRIQGNGK